MGLLVKVVNQFKQQGQVTSKSVDMHDIDNCEESTECECDWCDIDNEHQRKIPSVTCGTGDNMSKILTYWNNADVQVTHQLEKS
jgi:hypothetical protein